MASYRGRNLTIEDGVASPPIVVESEADLDSWDVDELAPGQIAIQSVLNGNIWMLTPSKNWEICSFIGGSGGSGSTVAVIPTLTDGEQVATIQVDGVSYSIYSPSYSTGTEATDDGNGNITISSSLVIG